MTKSNCQDFGAHVLRVFFHHDPECRCPRALEAVNKELVSLRAANVWDEAGVAEWADVRVKHPDAHIARIFSIVGVKNSEASDPALWRYKGRVVFGGDKISTTKDEVAMFTDIAASPSSMTAARALIALTCVTAKSVVLQSDCIQAYIQSPIQGAPTFIRLPKQWWPAEWARFKDPCCRLRLSLYGHPLSGLYWFRHLEARLVKLGYVLLMVGHQSVTIRKVVLGLSCMSMIFSLEVHRTQHIVP